MKITKSRLKKAIKEAMEGATPDAQLAELFGFHSKKTLAKRKAARAAQRAKEEEEYEAEEAKFAAKRQAAADDRATTTRMKAKQAAGLDMYGRPIRYDTSAGSKAGIESAYEKCKQSVEAGIRANRYGTHGNPSEAQEARNRCSEEYNMAMKKLRENQNKEGKAKITKAQLKKVIQEEVEKILAEV